MRNFVIEFNLVLKGRQGLRSGQKKRNTEIPNPGFVAPDDDGDGDDDDVVDDDTEMGKVAVLHTHIVCNIRWSETCNNRWSDT